MPAAIELAPNLWRVPTLPWDLVNSFLVRAEDGSFTLVDTGLAKAPPRIIAALSELGATPADVTRIVLTHAHSDHTGGAREMAERTGRSVTIHADDVEYATSGKNPPLDPTLRLGRLLSRMGGKIGTAPVESTMADGDLLEGCLLRVHHTPGHSPGHCSLVHEPTGVLITGDAIWNIRSRRTWPVLALCTNVVLNERSAATLADLDYGTAAFTHGPEIRGTGRSELRSFLANPKRIAPGL